MSCEINVPSEFQGNVIGALNKRKGFIRDTAQSEGYTCINANVALEDMFGYSTDLRSQTQGKGEFSMEYHAHEAVTNDKKAALMKEYQKSLEEARKSKGK